MIRILFLSSFFTLVVSSILVGCSTQADTTFDSANRAQGGLIGAATSAPKSWSGVLGSELVGGLVGNQLGQYMDKDDAQRAEIIYTSAKGKGRWVNHETGYIYTIKPVKEFKKAGLSCRVYKTRASIGDRRRTVYGTACKQINGHWQLAARHGLQTHPINLADRLIT
jgi:surface antigen